MNNVYILGTGKKVSDRPVGGEDINAICAVLRGMGNEDVCEEGYEEELHTFVNDSDVGRQVVQAATGTVNLLAYEYRMSADEKARFASLVIGEFGEQVGKKVTLKERGRSVQSTGITYPSLKGASDAIEALFEDQTFMGRFTAYCRAVSGKDEFWKARAIRTDLGLGDFVFRAEEQGIKF